MTAAGKPRLRLAATLWSLLHHPSKEREWTLARKVAAVKKAGFEGVQAAYRPELYPLLEQHGLAYIGALDASDPGQFARQVGELVAAKAVVANAQIGDHDTPTAEAIQLALAILAEAKRQGLRLQIETHRDTATETPEKFEAIAEGYEKITGELLPVTWDHSHFAVVKHLRPDDFVPRLLASPALVRRSRLIHCRPFNGHHCQVPVTDRRGQLTPEFRDWLVFAHALLAQWREGAAAGDELWIVPEQGAAQSGYNLTGFNRPWADAQVCAREVRRLWSEQEPAGRHILAQRPQRAEPL